MSPLRKSEMNMKLDRRSPCHLPTPPHLGKAWFYVNEGSITVLVESGLGTSEVTVPRKYLVAALAAMRQRPSVKKILGGRK